MNGDDSSPVTWGRYHAEHAALVDRIANLEETVHAGRYEHERLAQSRRDRLWVLILGLLSGLVFPLLVTAILTWLHLRSLQ